MLSLYTNYSKYTKNVRSIPAQLQHNDNIIIILSVIIDFHGCAVKIMNSVSHGLIKKEKVVDLFSHSSTPSKKFFINPTLFNFLIFFFLLQSFLLLSKMRYQDISASTLYSSQKISKASTLFQVYIADSIYL